MYWALKDWGESDALGFLLVGVSTLTLACVSTRTNVDCVCATLVQAAHVKTTSK